MDLTLRKKDNDVSLYVIDPFFINDISHLSLQKEERDSFYV